jgi:hypothetical protein
VEGERRRSTNSNAAWNVKSAQQGGAVVPHPDHFLQYITPRFTAAEVEKYAASLKARIAELEAQLAARDGQGLGGVDDKEVRAVPTLESAPRQQSNPTK